MVASSRPVLRVTSAALLLAACATSPPPHAAPDVTTQAPRAAPEPAAPPVAAPEQAPPSALATQYGDVVARIAAAAASDGLAYERLQHLCDVIGPRLSGSEGLERAVAWTARTMRDDGLDAVHVQEVQVPHWVRGREGARLVEPRTTPLRMLGLGNSVGTPEGGITAELVVARDFAELDALGDAPRGRIVLFDAAMPPYDAERGSGYGETVIYRSIGASRAAARGAVACLVRSVTARSLATPHTGMLRYEREAPEIPAAAVCTEDSAMLARLVRAGERVVVHLEMEAHFEADAPSGNVIGEITGSELPDEVVLLAAHLDSWDVGQGAHDDGGNCMAVLDALRLLRSLGLRPRRTIRAVLFTNEENGLRGSRDYVNAHALEIARYQAAIEADSGSYRPLGFTAPAAKDERSSAVRARLEEVAALLRPLGADRLRDGGGGADIGAMGAFGVPLLGLDVEGSRYFDVHHTWADTFDKIDRDELLACEAVLAATAYVLADMPERLAPPQADAPPEGASR